MKIATRSALLGEDEDWKAVLVPDVVAAAVAEVGEGVVEHLPMVAREVKGPKLRLALPPQKKEVVRQAQVGMLAVLAPGVQKGSRTVDSCCGCWEVPVGVRRVASVE